MNYPVELQYTKSHEWVKTEGDVTVVGISDFAQDALGDVVFVNLPGVGDEVTAEEAARRCRVRQGRQRSHQPGQRRGARGQ